VESLASVGSDISVEIQSTNQQQQKDLYRTRTIPRKQSVPYSI
jgi:hypothetical protein